MKFDIAEIIANLCTVIYTNLCTVIVVCLCKLYYNKSPHSLLHDLFGDLSSSDCGVCVSGVLRLRSPLLYFIACEILCADLTLVSFVACTPSDKPSQWSV